MEVQVLVKLAATDPWSFTVLETLRRKIGIEQVIGVDRVKCWELAFPATAEGRRIDIAGRVMSETALLANPNRDIWVLRAGAGWPVPSRFWQMAHDAQAAFIVKVSDKEDILGRSIQRILSSRLGLTEIESVRFSTIWILEMSEQRPGLEHLAGEIAYARSWRKGLLANPHFQDAVVARADEYFGMGVDRK